MRKVLRFFEIIIVGILLTLFVLTKISSSMILDKNTVKRELSDSGIYKEISTKLREEAHKELDQVFNRYPQIGISLDEILDNILTEDVLRDETNFILDSIYNFDEKIAIEPRILIDGYRNNLNEYLTEKNIELPKEVNDNIDKILNSTEIQKIDISEYTDDFNNYVHEYKQIVSFIHVAIYIILIAALLIMGFSVIVSKEKLKVVYKPLILSGILLLIVRLCGKVAFEALSNEIGDNFANNFVVAARNILFTNLTIFIICFLGLGISLMIVKIVLDRNKKKKELETA